MLYDLSSQLITHFRLSTIAYANDGLSSVRFTSRDRGIGSDEGNLLSTPVRDLRTGAININTKLKLKLKTECWQSHKYLWP